MRDRTFSMVRVAGLTTLVTLLASFPGGATERADRSGTVRGSGYGSASWYGEKFHGRRAASGELYNMYGMTGAHKSLPFNTMVRITNMLNDQEVIIRINDRGPYIEGRDFDLSYRAAGAIGMLRRGVVPVRYDILVPDEPDRGPGA